MDGFHLPTRCFVLRALALALLFVHALLTWRLIGGAWENLVSDEPLLTGSHSVAIYHGRQVAEAIRSRGLTAVVYDPAYQAGYLMTPWATLESRLACLTGLLAPDHPRQAYKIGVVLGWLLLPLYLWLMCRVCNSGSGAIGAALILFLSSAWSPWGIALLRAGETDVLLGTAHLGLALGSMVRCYARPRWWTAPLGVLSGAAAVYFWPATLALLFLCFLLLLSLLAGRLSWLNFCGLIGAMLGSLLLNSFWLREAWQTWWLLGESESRAVVDISQSLSLKANVRLLVWPGVLLVLGFLSTASLRAGIGGRSAFVWSFAIVITSLAALLPLEIPSLHLGKSHGWWWCSAWLAALPIGKCVAQILESLGGILGSRNRLAMLLALCALGLAAAFPHSLKHRCQRLWSTQSLFYDHSPDLWVTVEILKQQTTPEGRLLWEETPGTAAWAPVLPWLSERPFLGGLGQAEPCSIEALQVRLVQGTMQGRSWELWSDAELDSLAQTFNLGWVAAFHPTSQTRLQTWAGAQWVCDLPGRGKLYRLQRRLNYCCQGQATIQHADSHRITLTELSPVEGEVILSYHWQAAMRVTNSRVRMSPWQQPYDGLPLIRLQIPSPMARLTIEW